MPRPSLRELCRVPVAVACAIVLATAASAQSLPPIFERTPVALVAATTIAEFPVNTFLENIAIDAQGTLFVTSYEDGKVYRLAPGGARHLHAQVDGHVAGIALDGHGGLVVSGTSADRQPTMYAIDASGQVTTIARLDGGKFPNGVVRLAGERFLVADSYRGAIWEVDRVARTARIWLEDALLARADAGNPLPAVNGLKIDRGVLYASNTAKQILLRIPLGKGGAPGRPTLFVGRVNLDDFAFDRQGNLYGTTHVYQSVVRVTPAREITIVAGLDQGMAGSTAVAFGRTAADRDTLYVVTNGGMSLPPPGGVQPGKVVRLDVHAVGAAASP